MFSVCCLFLSELVHLCPNGTGRGSSEDECGQKKGTISSMDWSGDRNRNSLISWSQWSQFVFFFDSTPIGVIDFYHRVIDFSVSPKVLKGTILHWLWRRVHDGFDAFSMARTLRRKVRFCASFPNVGQVRVPETRRWGKLMETPGRTKVKPWRPRDPRDPRDPRALWTLKGRIQQDFEDETWGNCYFLLKFESSWFRHWKRTFLRNNSHLHVGMGQSQDSLDLSGPMDASCSWQYSPPHIKHD